MRRHDSPWEEEVLELGKIIFLKMGEEKPSLFRRDYWIGRMLEWCMEHPSFKVQMFRLCGCASCAFAPPDKWGSISRNI